MNTGESKIEVMFNRNGIPGTFLMQLNPDWRSQEYVEAVVIMRWPLGSYKTEVKLNPVLINDNFMLAVDTAVENNIRSYEKEVAKNH